MDKLNLQREIQHNQFSKKMGGILFLVFAVLSVIRVVVANRLVDDSSKLRGIDNKISAVEKENYVLASELRDQSSITLLENKAGQIGFVKTKTFSYVTADKPVAMGNITFNVR